MAETLLMPSGSGAAKVLDKVRKRYVNRRQGRGHARFVLWGLTLLVAAAAVVWTLRAGRTLSPTYDEPHHVATGLEWWQFHSSRWWTENPPLPKIAVGLGPHLSGMRLPDQGTWDPKSRGHDPWTVGNDLLYQDGGDPQRRLTLARVGNLPFLLLTLLMTFLLARGAARPWAGLVATALVATYPPLLGHAALATTDVATVATTLLFLYCLDAWWRRRRLHRAAVVGAAFGLALLCKLTAPLLCGAVAVGWLVGRRLTRTLQAEAPPPSVRPTPASTRRAAVPRVVRKPVAWPARGRGRGSSDRPLLFAAATALCGLLATFVVVWAGYRFSIARIDDISPVGYMRNPVLPPIGDRPAWLAWLCRLPLPAPEVPHGYLFLKTHHSHGHLAYLFGNVSDHGFWNFYLVGLALKSPLSFLLLVVIAAMVLVRLAGRAGRITPTGPAVGLAALAALALSTAGTVNIGLRHFLAIVPLVAIWIADAIDVLIEAAPVGGLRRLAMGSVALLLAAQAVIVERAEPELMAYFNPLAGREPGAALIDSDLDWGQDLALLKREFAARNIAAARVALFATGRPCGPDMPTLLPLVPRQPATGWIVISENYYRAADLIGLRRDPCQPSSAYGFHQAPADGFAWLRAHTPAARIGASLRLYHIDEPVPSAEVEPAAQPAALPETATAEGKSPARVPKRKRRTGQ